LSHSLLAFWVFFACCLVSAPKILFCRSRLSFSFHRAGWSREFLLEACHPCQFGLDPVFVPVFADFLRQSVFLLPICRSDPVEFPSCEPACRPVCTLSITLVFFSLVSFGARRCSVPAAVPMEALPPAEVLSARMNLLVIHVHRLKGSDLLTHKMRITYQKKRYISIRN
jgi:hypothetical protein